MITKRDDPSLNSETYEFHSGCKARRIPLHEGTRIGPLSKAGNNHHCFIHETSRFSSQFFYAELNAVSDYPSSLIILDPDPNLSVSHDGLGLPRQLERNS
jgi:hypothetical protein